MPSDNYGGMLFARLQLRAPTARSFLIAAPRTGLDAGAAARALAAAIRASGQEVQLLDVGPQSRPNDSSTRQVAAQNEPTAPHSADVSTVEGAQQLVRSAHGVTVISGAGLLDDPATLLLAAAVDAVVVVARRGKTVRSDLELARQEVERAGGRLVGGVLEA